MRNLKKRLTQCHSPTLNLVKCISMVNNIMTSYYQLNRERLLEKQHQYNTDHKGSIKKKKQQYRQKNKEQIKKYTIEYRKNNTEWRLHRNAYMRRYRLKDKNI